MLMVVVDAAGKLTKAEVVEATDQIFVEPSLEAVRKSTFMPALRNGQPVGCTALLPIRFSLTN
jgi:protein TonB